jgi:hypothetical protein
MPVNGPTGPSNAGPPRPTTTTETEDPTQLPTTQVINTEDTSALPSWMPNRTRAPRTEVDASVPITSDTVMQAAIDRFKVRFDSILHVDAMSLARGHQPFREGDTLTDQQQKDLMRATTDLLKDTPVSKLSPDLQSAVEGALRSRGIHRDLATTRLGDLGDAGEDLAKSFAAGLKSDKPGVYYGIGASAAAVLGYAAWEGGSDAMRRLGVKPEVKTKLFNDHLRVGAGADFDPHFANPRARLLANLDFPGQGIGRPDFRLGADARLTTGGEIETLTTSASMSTEHFSATAGATLRGNQVDTIAAAFSYTPTSSFALSGGAMWYEPDRRLTVGAEAAWRLSRDVSVGVSASHDNQGDSRVGVGARIAF